MTRRAALPARVPKGACARARRFLETWAWKCTMVAMLMFVLFVPDILALAGATNAADPAINALLLLCMATFLAELGANVACRPGYTLLEVGGRRLQAGRFSVAAGTGSLGRQWLKACQCQSAGRKRAHPAAARHSPMSSVA